MLYNFAHIKSNEMFYLQYQTNNMSICECHGMAQNRSFLPDIRKDFLDIFNPGFKECGKWHVNMSLIIPTLFS